MLRRRAPFPKIGAGDILRVRTSKTSLYQEPKRSSEAFVFIWNGVFLEVLDVKIDPRALWTLTPAGWAIITDGSDVSEFDILHPDDLYSLEEKETVREIVEEAWKLEIDRLERLASALTSVLIRSLSLIQAKKIIKNLYQMAIEIFPEAKDNTKEILSQSNFNALDLMSKSELKELTKNSFFLPKDSVKEKLIENKKKRLQKFIEKENNKEEDEDLNIPNLGSPSKSPIKQTSTTKTSNKYPYNINLSITYEDVLLIFSSQSGLKTKEIFNYILSACSRFQSHPRRAIFLVIYNSFIHFTMRPTSWVLNSLPIITTEEVRIANNKFIMSAAEGDSQLIKSCLSANTKLTNRSTAGNLNKSGKSTSYSRPGTSNTKILPAIVDTLSFSRPFTSNSFGTDSQNFDSYLSPTSSVSRPFTSTTQDVSSPSFDDEGDLNNKTSSSLSPTINNSLSNSFNFSKRNGSKSSNGQDLLCIHSELHYTAIHAAADFGQLETLNFLIASGISVNLREPKYGQTPLHFAGLSGRIEIAKRLLEMGARRDMKNSKGQLPYEVAEKNGHLICAELLKFLPPPPILSPFTGSSKLLNNDTFHFTPLPPNHTVQGIEITDRTNSSISLVWLKPILNLKKYAEVDKYKIECKREEEIEEVIEEFKDSTVDNNGNANNSLSIDMSSKSQVVTNGSNLNILKKKKIHTVTLSAIVTETNVTFSSLFSASTYKFRVVSHSAAGWGDWSNWIEASTLANKPSRPLGVEIKKVAKNGIFLNWSKNFRDNGFPIDFYEIEIMKSSILEEKLKKNPNDDDENNSYESNVGSSMAKKNREAKKILEQSYLRNSDSQEKDNKKEKNNIVKSQGGLSKSYRLIKHKDVNNLVKYITGLDPTDYHIRIRAHNQMGFSLWSQWCGPVKPQAGLEITNFRRLTKDELLDLNGENSNTNTNLSEEEEIDELQPRAAIATWVEPFLLPGRTVAAYELQLCRVKGPQTVTITVPQLSINSSQHLNSNSTPLFGLGMAGEEMISSPLINLLNNNNNTNGTTSTSFLDDYDIKSHYSFPPPTFEEFVTLSSSLTKPTYTICGLQAGGRYHIRVRVRVSGEEWPPWEYGMMSPAFVVPAMPPRPPFNILPMKVIHSWVGENIDLKNSLKSVKKDEKLLTHEDFFTDENGSNISDLVTLDMSGPSWNPPPNRINLETESRNSSNSIDCENDKKLSKFDYLITHDSITITWTQGDSNGATIDSYLIEMARIRENKKNDVILANEAFIGINDDNDLLDEPNDNTYHIRSEQIQPEDFNQMFTLEHSRLNTKTISSLNWVNVSSQGEFIGSQQFRVKNLIPGGCYIFRIKQHNEQGWSEYSKASPIISTYPSSPPISIKIFTCTLNEIILGWKNFELHDELIKDNKISTIYKDLTSIEYVFQIREVISISNNFSSSVSFNSSSIEFSTPWMEYNGHFISLNSSDFIKFKLKEGENPSNLFKLRGGFKPGTCYILRARLRTVVGWSPWSTPSDIFRMES